MEAPGDLTTAHAWNWPPVSLVSYLGPEGRDDKLYIAVSMGRRSLLHVLKDKQFLFPDN
jgi:hypothetical protein